MNYHVDVLGFAAAAWPNINWAMTGRDHLGYITLRGDAYGRHEIRRLDPFAFRDDQELTNAAFREMGSIATALQVFDPKTKRLLWHRRPR